MVSKLIWLGLVNAMSHPTFVQSLELIMALAKNFVTEEKVVKSVIGKVFLDLQPWNIEKFFHLPKVDKYVHISYEGAKRWYQHSIQDIHIP